jgi:hypothetical protein
MRGTELPMTVCRVCWGLWLAALCASTEGKIWLKGEQGTFMVHKDFLKADVFASWQPIPGGAGREMDSLSFGMAMSLW